MVIDIAGYVRITPEEIDPRGAFNLVRGIVEQAEHDYQIGVKLEKETRERSIMRAECEWFFRSAWFETITGLNGEYVLRRLKNERKGIL